mmetsp:Transcript_46592/g.108281  ORF Transcript_46592/g.108281 Transcript_46592/m.108281 type:complete len:205 (-) Transcript_46592:867-1481(-)
MLGKETQIISAVLEHVREAVAQVRLGTIHIVLDVSESDLRLDHPKLSKVARRVRVLSTKCRPKRVHRAEGARIVLRVELPRDGEEGLLAKEVCRVVHGARGSQGRVLHVERGHLEHLPRALAIRTGDEGRIDVHEPVLLEERVRRKRESVANAHHSAESVGPRPQVSERAQVLEAVLLLSKRVRGAIGDADDRHTLSEQLHCLA